MICLILGFYPSYSFITSLNVWFRKSVIKLQCSSQFPLNSLLSVALSFPVSLLSENSHSNWAQNRKTGAAPRLRHLFDSSLQLLAISKSCWSRFGCSSQIARFFAFLRDSPRKNSLRVYRHKRKTKQNVLFLGQIKTQRRLILAARFTCARVSSAGFAARCKKVCILSVCMCVQLWGDSK